MSRRPDRPRRDGKAGQKWVDQFYSAKLAAKTQNGGILPPTDSLQTTSFPHSDEWSEENLPDILFYIVPPPSEFAGIAVGELVGDGGELVKSDGGRIVRDFPILPRRIALDVPGWLIEAWRRIDTRITYQDILDRQVDDSSFGGIGLKKLSKNALQNHCRRDCRKLLNIWVEYGRRVEPHRTEVEAIEALSDQNLVFNSTLNQSEIAPHRLGKVKLVRNGEGGHFHVEPLVVTAENYLYTTYPADHFLKSSAQPISRDELMTPAMKSAFHMMLRLHERAMFHGVSHWSKLQKSCLPVTWFDRTKRKSIENKTDDGGCEVCTWEYGKTPCDVGALWAMNKNSSKQGLSTSDEYCSVRSSKRTFKQCHTPDIDVQQAKRTQDIFTDSAKYSECETLQSNLESREKTELYNESGSSSEWQLTSELDTDPDPEVEEFRNSSRSAYSASHSHQDNDHKNEISPDSSWNESEAYNQSDGAGTLEDFYNKGSSPEDKRLLYGVGDWLQTHQFKTSDPLQTTVATQRNLSYSYTFAPKLWNNYFHNEGYIHSTNDIENANGNEVPMNGDILSFARSSSTSTQHSLGSSSMSFLTAASSFGESPQSEDEYDLPGYGVYKAPTVDLQPTYGYSSAALRQSVDLMTSNSSPIRRSAGWCDLDIERSRSDSFSGDSRSGNKVYGHLDLFQHVGQPGQTAVNEGLSWKEDSIFIEPRMLEISYNQLMSDNMVPQKLDFNSSITLYNDPDATFNIGSLVEGTGDKQSNLRTPPPWEMS